MYNRGTINGNLVRDPQRSENGKYGFLTLANRRSFKNKDGEYETDFISILISGEKLVDFYCANFSKGDGVLVDYEVRTKPNKFDPEGKATEITLVTSGPVDFAVGKKSKPKSDNAETTTTTPEGEFNVADDADDDLPF